MGECWRGRPYLYPIASPSTQTTEYTTRTTADGLNLPRRISLAQMCLLTVCLMSIVIRCPLGFPMTSSVYIAEEEQTK
ncbi:hypothetical protein KC351_g77 [Hortaea werneckii]|nr:hypothetical protein KC351_g77 [Hortaea werneckii]